MMKASLFIKIKVKFPNDSSPVDALGDVIPLGFISNVLCSSLPFQVCCTLFLSVTQGEISFISIPQPKKKNHLKNQSINLSFIEDLRFFLYIL